MDTLEGGAPSGISMHYYEGGPDRATEFSADHVSQQLSTFKKVEDAVVEQRAILDGYRDGHKIGLILDEWCVWNKIPEDEKKRYENLGCKRTRRRDVAT